MEVEVIEYKYKWKDLAKTISLYIHFKNNVSLLYSNVAYIISCTQSFHGYLTKAILNVFIILPIKLLYIHRVYIHKYMPR